MTLASEAEWGEALQFFRGYFRRWMRGVPEADQEDCVSDAVHRYLARERREPPVENPLAMRLRIAKRVRANYFIHRARHGERVDDGAELEQEAPDDQPSIERARAVARLVFVVSACAMREDAAHPDRQPPLAAIVQSRFRERATWDDIVTRNPATTTGAVRKRWSRFVGLQVRPRLERDPAFRNYFDYLFWDGAPEDTDA